MNIVLIGYRGTGKTSVAQRVGELTGRASVDMDEEIAQWLGRPIRDFVAREGWEEFREVEAAVCSALARRQNLVIATGGGVILREDNVNALKAGGRIFWLTADPATLADRIRDDTGRHSLTGKRTFLDEIEEVLKERIPLYRAAADEEIDTSGRSIEEVAAEIVRRLPPAGQLRPAPNGWTCLTQGRVTGATLTLRGSGGLVRMRRLRAGYSLFELVILIVVLSIVCFFIFIASDSLNGERPEEL